MIKGSYDKKRKGNRRQELKRPKARDQSVKNKVEGTEERKKIKRGKKQKRQLQAVLWIRIEILIGSDLYTVISPDPERYQFQAKIKLINYTFFPENFNLLSLKY